MAVASGMSVPSLVHWYAKATPASQVPGSAVNVPPTLGAEPPNDGVGVRTRSPSATGAVATDSVVTVA